jgi:4a-hydroxytetrahydrobiopterin dehydratase
MEKNRRLEASEAAARLNDLPGWTLERDTAVSRQFVFPGFPEAVIFIVRLGFAAEAADHHPDLLVSYKRVTVTYSTHSAGGLTEKDFAGAKEATALAALIGG